MPYLHHTKHKGDFPAHPARNIAFAEDWQEDVGEMTIIFAGADPELLEQLFTYLSKAGVMSDFYLTEQHPPRYRLGVVWDRIGCVFKGYDTRMASADSLALVIERWLRQHVHVSRIERYTVDDILNLTGHERHLALNDIEKSEEENQEPMANIYLKIPWYVACWLRGRDEDHQLTEWEPVKFADFDHEYQMMINTLRNIPEQNQTCMCYSQHAWNNILKGKCPDGSMLIMNRDQTKWPDSSETATLTGVKKSDRHNASDYICIEMPREVWIGKRTYRTNACYSMSHDAAYKFAAMLTDRFCYEYTQWFYQDQRIARSQGFKRKQNESVERFFVQFNFPVIIDPRLRESMRRQHTRFIKKGMSKPAYGLQFEHSFLEHISDDDKKKIELNKKKNRI